MVYDQQLTDSSVQVLKEFRLCVQLDLELLPEVFVQEDLGVEELVVVAVGQVAAGHHGEQVGRVADETAGVQVAVAALNLRRKKQTKNDAKKFFENVTSSCQVVRIGDEISLRRNYVNGDTFCPQVCQ